MYLKALEIQGFKSFPEKTRLIFDKDITAIVGPNGSGKSNISDALLWVMGEQRTRTLRGGKMQDVIFGGTEKRQPMGYAQVTLILDNSQRILPLDNDEACISRRYYRSGDSEYYINKEQVRLKDITELLTDTGLGTDGYSIIGQGRISEIVSAKSTDRREIFEEAAGIARYRHRKDESERKLEKAEENLLRIGDKISELELQVGPLKKQSEVAKQYLLYRDDLRGKEISLWCANLDKIHDQADMLRRDFEKSKNDCMAARSAQDRFYAESERLAGRMRETDVEAESLREQLRTTEGSVAELESSLAVLATNLKNNADSLDRLQKEMDEQSSRADNLLKQIEEHKSRISAIEKEYSELTAQEEKLRARETENARNMDEKNQQLSGMLTRESELNSLLAESRTAVLMLSESLDSLNQSRNEAKDNIALAEEKKKEAETQLMDIRRQLSSAKEKEDSLSNVISGHSMLMSSREAKVSELSEKATNLTVELRSCESRLNMLSELEKQMEGFSKAEKVIMREASNGTLQGVRGPLGKAIRTDSKYALAIETALGAAVGHIIMDSQFAAKSAMEFLKRQDGGRTTFLPIDVLKPRTLRETPDGENGYIGICSDLIETDKTFKNVVANQLGATVLVETLADAVRISRKFNQAFRIVTLDGQLVNAGGSMTGGSVAKSAGILSRANEIERLKLKKEKLQNDLSSVTEEKQEAERILENARYDLETAREECSVARQECARLEGLLSQAELLNDTAESALEALDNDILNASLRKKELSARRDELNLTIRKSEEELSELHVQMEKESKGVANFEQRRKEFEEQFSALRSAKASLEAEKNTVQLAIQQLEQLRNQLRSDTGNSEAASEALKRNSEELETEKQIQAEKLLLAQKKAAEEKGRVDELTARRLDLEGRRSTADKNAQEKNRELLDLEHNSARLEQKMLSAEMEEKQILDKLWDSYELSRSEAVKLAQPVDSMAQAARDVAEMRRKITALGTPNLGAIEEYQRVSERYEFLSGQRDDAEKAREEILKILSEITGRMEEIFVNQIQLIDKAFQSIFAELFGGGQASLSLEDESDVLNCGIDIRIQPPGKAVSNISLLSGGEKAFVAIALYFAIMRVRPTPFCVMDEIESALDEENVQRFADYMRRMSKKTQFIAITHRRGTMEQADQLYGVTMQEKGVSTVLSMDMQQALKTIR